MLSLSYINLTPGLKNEFSSTAHHSLLKILRRHYESWTGFFERHPDFKIGFIIATKKDVVEVEVKGPSITNKFKVVDFTIFLPQDVNSMKNYLDNFFKGLNIFFKKYNITPTVSFIKDIETLYQTLAS